MAGLVTDKAASYELIFLPGSEHSAKVHAAMRYLAVPVKLTAAPFLAAERKRILPAPHLVPVLRAPIGHVIIDSHDILEYLNDYDLKCAGRLFPRGLEDEVAGVEREAAVAYYQVLYVTTCVLENSTKLGMYERSYETSRSWLRVFGSRASYCRGLRDASLATIAAAGYEGEIDAEDPKRGLKRVLSRFEDRISAAGNFLCSDAAPTAADFALFGALVNLVQPGYLGFHPALYEAEVAFEGLPKLRAWHSAMVELAAWDQPMDWSATVADLVERGEFERLSGPKLREPLNKYDATRHGKPKVEPLTTLDNGDNVAKPSSVCCSEESTPDIEGGDETIIGGEDNDDVPTDTEEEEASSCGTPVGSLGTNGGASVLDDEKPMWGGKRR